MAAQGSVKDWYTFVGGLNTEGGYFVTPDGTWKQGRNIVPQLDGSIQRRNGLDFEENADDTIGFLPTDIYNDYAVTVGKWSPEAGVDLVVTQVGYMLYFFTDTSYSVSSNQLLTFVDLRNYPVDAGGSVLNAVTGSKPCSYAQAFNILVVTTEETQPIKLTYSNERVSSEGIIIKIRDFEGLDTYGKDPTEELTETEWVTYYNSLVPALANGDRRALYNLKNQGWNNAQITTYKAAHSNDLPSNTKAWIYGKDTSDNFDATLLNKQEFGTSLALKGRFIIDAFNQVRTEQSTSFTKDYSVRPSITTFFAGRIWYSGLNNKELAAKVYFSQVLDDINKLGYCYQANDPTAEILSDLVDSDGGVIEIPEAGQIVKLVPLGRGLLVFAENGIFAISGIDGVFSATNFQVEKVTSVGTTFPQAIVIIENAVVYWANEGIYALSAEAGGLSYATKPLTDGKIKSFYTDISYFGKQKASGAYNGTTNEVQWLFDNSTETTVNTNSKKNVALIYNVVLQSWYVHDLITEDDTHASFIYTSKPTALATTSETVTTSAGTTVTNSALQDVTVNVNNSIVGQEVFKVLSKQKYDGDYNTKLTATDINTYTGTKPAALTSPVTGNKGNDGIYHHGLWSNDQGSDFGLTSYLVLWSTLGTTYTTLNVSETSSWHSGYGAWAYYFNRKGTRLYLSLYNTTSGASRILYLNMSTPWNLSTITGGITIGTYTGLSVNRTLFTDMKLCDNVNFVMGCSNNASTTMHFSVFDTDDEGNLVPATGNLPTYYNGEILSSSAHRFTSFSFLSDNSILTDTGLGQYGYNALYTPTILDLPLPGRLDLLLSADISTQVANNSRKVGTGVDILHGIYDNTEIYSSYWNGSNIETQKYEFAEPVNFTLIGGGLSASYESIRFNFADYINTRDTSTKFIDWYSQGYTTEKEAFVTTGYHMADNGPARQKSGTYLTTFAKRTETALDENGDPINPSQINMQVRWDFTDNESTNKWTTTVNVYRPPRVFIGNPGDTYDDGYPLVVSKTKIRGRGKALQFRYSSESGYDMKLVGWTGTFVGNTNV